MDTKELLTKQKSRLLERLATLACSGRTDKKASFYRKKANEILQEFVLADCALDSIALVKPSDFKESERPIDAILAYLEKSGSPMLESALIEAVVSGGFRPGDPKARLIVLKSIGNHLRGTGAKKQLIKSVNGRIGKWEWDESVF